MPSVRLQWEGLDELRRELAAAPREVRDDAFRIVRAHVDGAASEIRSSYQGHRVTGTLLSRLRTDYPSASILFGQVRSAAPHGSLFEFGAGARRTDRGANRGRMPAAKTFVPIAQAWRARMVVALSEMLTRRGFSVSGD